MRVRRLVALLGVSVVAASSFVAIIRTQARAYNNDVHHRPVVNVIFTLALLCVALPVQAGTQPQIGKSCSRQGQIRSSTQGILKCTKTSKGLRWKSVPKKVAPVAVSDAPVITSPVEAIFKLLDGTAKDLNQSTASLDVTVQMESPSHYRAAESQDAVSVAARMFSGMTKTPVSFTVILFVSDAWYQAKFDELRSKECQWKGDGPLLYRAAVACPTVVGLDMDHLKGHPSGPFAFEIAHEMFHLIQLNRLGGVTDTTPGWFREGSANVMGRIARTHNFGKVVSYADTAWGNSLWRLSDCRNALDLWRAGDFMAVHTQTNECEYGAGTIMSELLVERAGSAKVFITILDLVASGVSFDSALKQTVGLSNAAFIDLSAESIRQIEVFRLR